MIDTVEQLAKQAVIDYLEDGLEFDYIHEHEDAQNFSQVQMVAAHDMAIATLRGLIGKVVFE